VSHYKFPKEDLVQKFYQGLSMASRMTIDASTGGSIIELTSTEGSLYSRRSRIMIHGCCPDAYFQFNPQGMTKVYCKWKRNLLEGMIDSLMRRLERMELEKKEAQDLKAVEERSTCEECREYVHVQKDCPEEANMLD
jgi:hypothetical protein